MSKDAFDIVERLEREFAQSKSYAEIGKRYGINRGLVWQIINNGHVPQDPEIRRKLGLPRIDTITQYRSQDGQFTKRG